MRARSTLWVKLPLIGLFVIVTCVSLVPAAAAPAGLPADLIGVVKIAKGEPIVLAYWLWRGDSFSDEEVRRGIEIAVAERKGRLLGHPIQLTGQMEMEDLGADVAVATRFASDPRIVAVIGPTSENAVAGAPILWRAGIVSVSHYGPRVEFLSPKRRRGYDGLLFVGMGREIPGSVAARYASEILKAKRAAMITRIPPYEEPWGFARTFKALGGIIVTDHTISRNDTDFGQVLREVAAARPDVIYYDVDYRQGGSLILETRRMPALANAALMGTQALFSREALKEAGTAANGLYLTHYDNFGDAFAYRAGARGERVARARKRKYRWSMIFGLRDFYGVALGYDATSMIMAAIEKVAKSDADGTVFIGRKALRDALYATRDFPGLTGKLTCDRFGYCAHPNIAIYQIVSTAWKEGENPKGVFP